MYYEQEFLGFDSSYIFLNSLGLEYNAVELFLVISILAILPLRDITPSKRLKTPSDIIVYAIIAAILVLYGKIIFQSNLYLISIYSSIGLTIIAVMGLNIVTGLCGQISVAHGALSGIGAYTTALLVTKAGFPIYINIPLACLAGAVFGAFIGCFSFLKNFWLGIFTLFFSIYTTHAFENVPFFGGPSGISRIGISGISGLDRIKYLFYVIMGGIVLSFVIYEYVRKSEFGKKMIAIKEGELTSHRETYRYKITAFALSGFLAGLSGSLLSYKTSFINPASFTLTESAFVLYIFMAGGPGSRMGPLLSTIILSFSYEFFRGYVHPLMTIYFALIGIFIYRFLFRDFLVKKMPDLPVR